MSRKFNIYLFFILISAISGDENPETKQVTEESAKTVQKHNVKVAESHLSAQVFAIIDHYKQDDPVGLPGATVPDPMPIPEVKQSMSFGKMHLKNVLAYGLSKFRIKHLKTNLNDMNVQGVVQMDQMITKGNYTLSTLFSRAEGPFIVNLTNVVVKGKKEKPRLLNAFCTSVPYTYVCTKNALLVSTKSVFFVHTYEPQLIFSQT
jgi:hypothetical protein